MFGDDFAKIEQRVHDPLRMERRITADVLGHRVDNRPALAATTLFLQPSAQPLARFLSRIDTARRNICPTVLDLFQYVQVVLNVFQRAVVGKVTQQLFDFLLRSGHGRAPVFAGRHSTPRQCPIH
jgi:hypothetical protein